jgi:hypothetical protein
MEGEVDRVVWFENFVRSEWTGGREVDFAWWRGLTVRSVFIFRCWDDVVGEHDRCETTL